MTTLYERMGGDASVKLAIAFFFEYILEDEDLAPFFENISVNALEHHQLKLFRVIFGPEEETPDQDDFLNFMLCTHTRLFRDCGLDETHFDKVAVCFVRSLQELQADQDVVDEGVAILGPLRAVFECGARIAAKEKTLGRVQLSMVPTTNAQNMYGEEATRLPDPAHIDIPSWLPKTLETHSNNGNVRAWTKLLTESFGADGDTVIADTFMDAPYMNHHIFLVAFLQLAFLPEDHSSSSSSRSPDDLLPVVRYPRGPNKRPLCQALWQRMTNEFEKACNYFAMEPSVTNEAVEKLKSHKHVFRKTDKIKKVGGLTNSHVLRHCPVAADFNFAEVNFLAEVKKDRQNASGHSIDDESLSRDGTAVETVCTSNSNAVKPTNRNRVWRRLLGWTKVLAQ
jgi:hemoglobin